MIATAPPEPVFRRVEETLRDLRKNNVRAGIVYAVVVAAALFAAAVLIAITLDWYFAWLSATARWCVSITAWLIVATTLVTVIAKVVHRRRRQDELAEQADHAAPAFEERLQTIVSVHSTRFSADPEMMGRVLAETESLYSDIDPNQIVERHRFGFPLAILAVCASLLLFSFAFATRSTAILVARFLWPATSLTRTVVSAEFGDQVVAEGEPWRLNGQVEGQPVSTTLLQRKLSDSEMVHRTLPSGGDDGNALSYEITRAKESFAYRLTASDFRSDWSNVTVAPRPRIVGAEVRVIPPKYTKRKEQLYSKVPRRITVLKGSKVELRIRVEGDIDRAEWILAPGQGTRSMFEDEEGSLLCSLAIDSSVRVSPRLIEPHGLENKDRFEIKIQAIEDKPPTVKITHPSPDTSVRPDDKVRIEFEARDDIAVQRADVIIYQTDAETGEVRELIKIPVSMKDQRDRRRVNAGVEVDLAKLGLEHGQTINYRVDVYDQKQTGNADSADPDPSDENSSTQESSLSESANNAESKKQGESSEEESSSDSESNSESENMDQRPDTSSEAKSEANPDANKDTTAGGDEKNPNASDAADQSRTETDRQTEGSKNDSTNDKNSDSMNSKGDATSPGSQSKNSSRSSNSSSSAKPDESEPDADASDERTMRVDSSEDDSKEQNPSDVMNDQANETSRSKDMDENPDSDSAENDSPPKDSPAKNSSANSASGSASKNKPNSSTSSSSQSGNPKSSNPPSTPDDSPKPTMRTLDVSKPPSKPSSSPTMELKIDKFAGSFEGQARKKLEIAIDPVLKNLEKWLTACEDLLASVQVGVDEAPRWDEGRQQSLARAIAYLDKSTEAVDELISKTNKTPYAFIGLQLSDISLTHMDPAKSDAIAAMKTNSSGRHTLVNSSRSQVQRAIERLKELTARYEREKREQEMAEKIQEFEKVYRIYIEDTLAKLKAQKDRINELKRKGVEFDLDEEYLRRLQEILEMRRDLEAELARILSEDPRLLKRFSESERNNADTLRDQFTLLARRQFKLTKLTGELESSISDPEGSKNTTPASVAMRTLEVAYRLTSEFAEALDRFDTWMPLSETAQTTDTSQAFDGFRDAAGKSERLRRSVLEQAQKLNDGTPDYESTKKAADEFIASMNGLRQQLIALISTSDNTEITANATNRLLEVSQVREKMLGWRFQIDALVQRHD